MKQATRYTLLNDTLSITLPAKLFLNQIKNGKFDESQFFGRLAFFNKYNEEFISFVIKVANVNKEFEIMCKKPEYDGLWGEQYRLVGYKLTYDLEKCVNLLPHKSNNFDLLRGIYFYMESQKVRDELKSCFSSQEILFLEEAMKYKSVHATQEYNYYLFFEALENSFLSIPEKTSLLDQAIKNCKMILASYGSYAYMMLAEAYVRFAELSQKNSNFQNKTMAIEAAKKSINFAKTKYEMSLGVIFNASLGRGIEKSNSFSLNPEQALEMLNKNFG
jgi:hypothetical protein